MFAVSPTFLAKKLTVSDSIKFTVRVLVVVVFLVFAHALLPQSLLLLALLAGHLNLDAVHAPDVGDLALCNNEKLDPFIKEGLVEALDASHCELFASLAADSNYI